MSDRENKVICRFPPSPTGPFHVGSARTALFNYLFAKQHGGKFFLRIEDTDKERSKTEFERDIIESLAWLGIPCDNQEDKSYWKQSERGPVYKKYLEKLVETGLAYVSKEETAESGKRTEVIRFKNPNKKIIFDDLIRGTIEFDTGDLKDFVVAKSLEEPLYHLAVVIDDFETGVTHVIRGEDGISNTPRQILLQEALGFPRPTYAHLPLILAPDRSKLSKRKHGESVSLKYYREQGYFPEALVNFLALLGWNPGDDREVFSQEELIKEFRLDKVQKSGAIFNVEKLNWLNKEYLSQLPKEDSQKALSLILSENPSLGGLKGWQQTRLSDIILDRIHFYGEARTLAAKGEFDYFAKLGEYPKESLLWKKAPDAEKTALHLKNLIDMLEPLDEMLDAGSVKSVLFPYAEKNGKGEVLWPLRFSLSGREQSADPFTIIGVLGKKESLKRLTTALNLLK